jgi:hypothetical protein
MEKVALQWRTNIGPTKASEYCHRVVSQIKGPWSREFVDEITNCAKRAYCSPDTRVPHWDEFRQLALLWLFVIDDPIDDGIISSNNEDRKEYVDKHIAIIRHKKEPADNDPLEKLTRIVFDMAKEACINRMRVYERWVDRVIDFFNSFISLNHVLSTPPKQIIVAEAYRQANAAGFPVISIGEIVYGLDLSDAFLNCTIVQQLNWLFALEPAYVNDFYSYPKEYKQMCEGKNVPINLLVEYKKREKSLQKAVYLFLERTLELDDAIDALGKLLQETTDCLPESLDTKKKYLQIGFDFMGGHADWEEVAKRYKTVKDEELEEAVRRFNMSDPITKKRRIK